MAEEKDLERMTLERKVCKKVKIPKETAWELVLKYYKGGVSMQNLSDEYHISKSHVSYLLNHPIYIKKITEWIEGEKIRVNARKEVALLRAAEAAPDLVSQIIKISQQEVTKDNMQYQYVIQNACTELLNRTNVKVKEEEQEKEVVVRFENMPSGGLPFEPGMPDKQ